MSFIFRGDKERGGGKIKGKDRIEVRKSDSRADAEQDGITNHEKNGVDVGRK